MLRVRQLVVTFIDAIVVLSSRFSLFPIVLLQLFLVQLSLALVQQWIVPVLRKSIEPIHVSASLASAQQTKLLPEWEPFQKKF